MAALWASDSEISKPSPATRDRPALLTLGEGFGFSGFGFCFDLSQADLDELFTPPIMPDVDSGAR